MTGLDALRASAPAPGAPLAVVTRPGGVALAVADGAWDVPTAGDRETAGVLAALDAELRPRWTWWSARAAALAPLTADPSLRLSRCWDLAAVHRLLHGGSADDPAHVWATRRGLDAASAPRTGQLDLLAPSPGDGGEGDRGSPVRPDGHLRPDWSWERDAGRSLAWARLALEVQEWQAAEIARERRHESGGDAVATAWSESAAELVAVELTVGGLPVDVAAAESVLADQVGPRPRDAGDAARMRRARDEPVLACVPGAGDVDLHSPARVRGLLAGIGLDVPDTRSWRLERVRDVHPVVDALLRWRSADRFATTYGYRWLDEHVSGGRLRGAWSGSDGGAGRMTALSGLHSMPAELRRAVRAEPGHLLVRADLGQVEPRVLAAVSGDAALAAAAREDDLYAPVAQRLGCERGVAKVAVLAAMYGQTSGTAGQALAGMESAYPVALRYLRSAADAGREGRPLRTYGGRAVRMYPLDAVPVEAPPVQQAAYRSALAGRGRFARNAVVQGAAAELFKAWTATVRLRLAQGSRSGSSGSSGTIVLCLHDELLLHVREEVADEVARDVVAALEETAGRWCRGTAVRFVADVAVVECWSDAKG